ncbi:hypothetical protein ACIBF5_15855 [Micromonospora sp. NPDC050417]|uniref:hypothetical protein n=1 Tax=Micromonospora sp. NPDC050417 TaxID=3364280 RepID=UPI0037A7249D
MVVLRGVVLRDLVVELEPGEWYAGWELPAVTRKAVRLGDVDRIRTRMVALRGGGQREEMWVSGHKPECGQHPEHQGCIAEYVALAAVERALAQRGTR